MSVGLRAEATAGESDPAASVLKILTQDSNAGGASIEQLIQLATVGDSEAQYQLGIRYRDQTDDVHEAFEWLERASQAGHVEASFALGVLYAEWDETEQALRWLEYAAINGHQRAGNIYRYMLSNDFTYGC